MLEYSGKYTRNQILDFKAGRPSSDLGVALGVKAISTESTLE